MKRECTLCPPAVIRCAHWGDWVAFLADYELAPPGVFNTTEGRYKVNHGIGQLVVAFRLKGEWFRTDDLAEAEAEFHRREAELLAVTA